MNAAGRDDVTSRSASTPRIRIVPPDAAGEIPWCVRDPCVRSEGRGGERPAMSICANCADRVEHDPAPPPPTAAAAGRKTVRFAWLFAVFSFCAALAACALAVVFVVLPAERQDQLAESWLEHTYQVIKAIDDVQSSAAAIEIGQRGYLVSGDARDLARYARGLASLWPRIAVLQGLTHDNPDQQARLEGLREQLRGPLAEFARRIALARDGDPRSAADAFRAGQGKAVIDAVRGTTADMIAKEELLLHARRTDYENSHGRANEILLLLIIFAGVGVVTGGGAIALAASSVGARRRSEAAAAERLRLLDQFDFAAIMLRDLDGIIRFWSRGCERLYGWTAEQAIGRDARTLLHKVFPVAAGAIDADLRRSGEWSGEVHSRSRDGRHLHVQTHMFLEDNDGGGGLTVMETLSDITSLRKAERELRASEARLGLFIKHAPAAIAMFDMRMRYVAASDRFVADYALHGETPESLIGRSHYALFPEVPEHWREIHRRVLEGETMLSDGDAFSRSDGRVNWLRWEMVPWRDAGGVIGGALLFSEDITEQRAAEAALRDSEARLQQVQRVSGIGYFDRLLSEKQALVSGAFIEMFGLSGEQIRFEPKDLLPLIHPDDRERVGRTPSLAMAHGGMLLTEFRIRRPDGRERWIGMRSDIMSGPDGQPYRTIAALQDITDIVAARAVLAARHDELERSNADLEEFAYTVSHDLKAPLRAIAHLAEWIGEDMTARAAPETRDNIVLLQGRVGRMQKLLEGLLDYSRAGHMGKTTEAVAVQDVLNDIVAMQGLQSNFAVAYAGEKLTLRTQRVALQVVLENLIGNSVKHHDRGQGCITVATRRVDGLVEFRVSDDGPGIPEQFHQRIFEIFQTLRSRDDREASGIGLAIVKRKVESHGGQIRVDQPPPERGAAFVFTWKEEVGAAGG